MNNQGTSSVQQRRSRGYSAAAATQRMYQDVSTAAAPSTSVLDSNDSVENSNLIESKKARIASLSEGLHTLRSRVDELTRTISMKNSEYIRREEALCDQIADVKKVIAMQESNALTGEEQRATSQRTQRAAQLHHDIVQAEERLKAAESELNFAETARQRLQNFVNTVEREAQLFSTFAESTVDTIRQILTSSSGSDSINDKKDDDRSDEYLSSEFRRCYAHTCEARTISIQASELAKRMSPGVASAMSARAEAESCAEERFQTTQQQLKEHTSLLEETQSALVQLHADVAERRQCLENNKAHVQALENSLKSLRAPASTTSATNNSAAVVENSIFELEATCSTLTLELTQLEETAAVHRAETLSAKERYQHASASLDEANQLAEQRKQTLRDSEQEKSLLNRRCFQCEEAIAALHQSVTRLASESADVEDECSALEIKTAQLRKQQGTLQGELTQAESVVAAKREELRHAQRLLSDSENQKMMVERELQALRQEKTEHRQKIVALQTQLTAAIRTEQSTIRELQYIHQLLPKNHPSAKLSSRLKERAAKFAKNLATSESDLMSVATSMRDELVQSARKSLRPPATSTNSGADPSQTVTRRDVEEDDEHFASPPAAPPVMSMPVNVAATRRTNEIAQQSVAPPFTRPPLAAGHPLADFFTHGEGTNFHVPSDRSSMASDEYRLPNDNAHSGAFASGKNTAAADAFESHARTPSVTSSSTHASSIADINEKLNAVMNRRRGQQQQQQYI